MTTVSPLPRRAGPQQLTQKQAQVERADVDQLPLQNVLVSPQMRAPHPAVNGDCLLPANRQWGLGSSGYQPSARSLEYRATPESSRQLHLLPQFTQSA